MSVLMFVLGIAGDDGGYPGRGAGDIAPEPGRSGSRVRDHPTSYVSLLRIIFNTRRVDARVKKAKAQEHKKAFAFGVALHLFMKT